jgi:hypothetical protein
MPVPTFLHIYLQPHAAFKNIVDRYRTLGVVENPGYSFKQVLSLHNTLSSESDEILATAGIGLAFPFYHFDPYNERKTLERSKNFYPLRFIPVIGI